jgi:hypothetical protein
MAPTMQAPYKSNLQLYRISNTADDKHSQSASTSIVLHSGTNRAQAAGKTEQAGLHTQQHTYYSLLLPPHYYYYTQRLLPLLILLHIAISPLCLRASQAAPAALCSSCVQASVSTVQHCDKLRCCCYFVALCTTDRSALFGSASAWGSVGAGKQQLPDLRQQLLVHNAEPRCELIVADNAACCCYQHHTSGS